MTKTSLDRFVGSIFWPFFVGGCAYFSLQILFWWFEWTWIGKGISP